MPQLSMISRVIELLIGGLFLLAAVLKTIDPNLFVAQIYGYGVITDPVQLRFVAIFATSIEAALGLALVMGLRLGGLVHLATQAMLVFYTALIAYAWVVHGLEDCGCFGDVKIPPEMGIVKNIAMMAALALAAFLRLRAPMPDPAPRHMIYMKLIAGCLVGLLTAGSIMPQLSKRGPGPVNPVELPEAVYVTPDSVGGTEIEPPSASSQTKPDPRFAGIRVADPLTGEELDLAKGMLIVAMLNMDCDHCMDAVPALNEFAFDPNVPPVVAICWEPAAGKMDEFVAMTAPQFAMHNLGNDFLKFSEYIGGAPPRISIVRDGQELHYWDKEAPSMDELYAKLDELQAGPAPEAGEILPESQQN